MLNILEETFFIQIMCMVTEHSQMLIQCQLYVYITLRAFCHNAKLFTPTQCMLFTILNVNPLFNADHVSQPILWPVQCFPQQLFTVFTAGVSVHNQCLIQVLTMPQNQ